MYHFRTNPPSRQIAPGAVLPADKPIAIPLPNLLPRIEAYMAARKMTPSAFGRMVINDPVLVPDLRAGRSLTRRVHNRIAEYLDRGDAQEGRGNA